MIFIQVHSKSELPFLFQVFNSHFFFLSSELVPTPLAMPPCPPWCHGATVALEVRPELFGTGPSVLAPGEVVLRRPRRAWGINDTSVPQFAGRLLTVVDFFF